jgi:hypothetical protein
MQLCLLLFQLLKLTLHLSHQHDIVHFRVFSDLLCQFIELCGQIFLLHCHSIVLLGQLLELDFQLEYSIFECLVLALVVFATHLVFLELSQQTLQFVSLHAQLFQRFLHLIIWVFHFQDLRLVFLWLLVDFLDFGFMVLDKFEIISCDLVVIVLQLVKCLLMVFH